MGGISPFARNHYQIDHYRMNHVIIISDIYASIVVNGINYMYIVHDNNIYNINVYNGASLIKK